MTRSGWAIILFGMALMASCGTDPSEGESLETSFSGTVTDIDTGEPIVNASIYVRNYTMEVYFFGRTDERGTYSVQVGKGGIYMVDVTHDTYEFVTTETEISSWEQKRLDLSMRHYENNCNILVMKKGHIERDGGFLPFSDAIVELEEDVPNGSFYSLRSDIDGWANITVPPGDYTLTAYAPQYRTFTSSVHIGIDDYCFSLVTLGRASVSSDTPNTLIDGTYTIPARSALVLGIATEEEYPLYFQFRSDRIVSGFTVPGENIGSFLNWTKGYPVENGSTPLYDFAIMDGRNGGMTYSTWTNPCHIVIVNDGNDPTNVQVMLKYEYGTFDLAEPSIVSLDDEEKDDLRWIEIMAGPAIATYFLLMIALIVIIVFFGIRRDKKDKGPVKGPTSLSRHGMSIGPKPSRGPDRSARPYRGGADRSYR